MRAALLALRAGALRHWPWSRCVYCRHRGPLKNHCGTGDLVCRDDNACLTRGMAQRGQMT